MREFESDTFSMGRGDFALKMFPFFGWRWLIWLSIGAVAAIVAAFVFDLRIMIVGLALIFLIIPAVAAWLYYYYGLRRECFVNVIPHKLSISEDGIVCRVFFYPYKDKDDAVEDNADEKETDKVENSHVDEPEYRDYLFEYSTMSPYTVYPKGILLPLGSPEKGFLWMPESAWRTPEDFTDFTKALGGMLQMRS